MKGQASPQDGRRTRFSALHGLGAYGTGRRQEPERMDARTRGRAQVAITGVLFVVLVVDHVRGGFGKVGEARCFELYK